MLLLIAVLISGGENDKSAEIYLPTSNTGCSLPELPEEREYHTQNGDLACGGSSRDTGTSCVMWANGSWTTSHILNQRREYHVSWATASGVYLMGGEYSMQTSELVKEDNSVESGFDLKYPTRYNDKS